MAQRKATDSESADAKDVARELRSLTEQLEIIAPAIEKVIEQNQKAWDALRIIHERAKLMSPEAGEMVAQVLAVMSHVPVDQPAKCTKKSPAKKARKKPGA